MSDRVYEIVKNLATDAKKASFKLSLLSTDQKNKLLVSLADELIKNKDFIKSENNIDLKAAKESGLSKSLLDRLKLDDDRIEEMAKSVNEIAKISDPVGKLITEKKLENGINLKKIRVPIGVIGIIFESRPNVVSDVAALCLKSGNAVILRGGKEAQHSNRAIMSVIEKALKRNELPPSFVSMIPIIDRSAVNYLCKLNDFVDVIIPRGGEGLIKTVIDCATVPVIKHYKGVCHIYVDESANIDKALDICHNAKCQRPSVCNAVETILVNKNIANDFIKKLYNRLEKENVEMRGDEESIAICSEIKPVHDDDWYKEYLDLIVSIKVVKDTEEAINHINHYGSHHSDAIISESKKDQNQFVRAVDSCAVYVNASTRFTDGSMFGLGAEMGISTDKLHARGPMGLNELTTYKWIAVGNGQIRE